MYGARTLRHNPFGSTKGDRGDKRMRSIVLHFEPATTDVDGFACSACAWFHFFTTSDPDGTLSRREVDQAHDRYHAHDCADYPRANTGDHVP